MALSLKGNDYLYLALGGGVLWLILKNSKTISTTLTNATSVINPLLGAAGKGAVIVSDPASWKPSSYTAELLKAPFSASQAWTLFKQQPGISTGINAVFTSWGLYK